MNSIYLAFTNDKSTYLNLLEEESKTIAQVFEPLRQRGGHIYRDEWASTESMANFLMKHRNEVAVFHYSGGPAVNFISRSDAVAYHEGLLPILSKCPNLRLIFWSRSATRGQIEQLLQLPQGVAVIATNTAIDDRSSTLFAEYFYKFLVERFLTIKEAFEAAVAAVDNQKISIRRSIDRLDAYDTSFIGLYIQKGREEVMNWKLELGDVKIERKLEPRPTKIRNNFKFLDPYDLEDEDIFFGREREADELYERSFLSGLLLVYGAAGTGKTSLINCGFQNRFSGTDRLIIKIRRRSNLVKSVKDRLASNFSTSFYSGSIGDSIFNLFEDQLIPIFLVFDQLEELFILGDRSEQEDFFKIVREILETPVPCKVILVLRDAYLAALSDYEELVPGLLDNRFRVYPMDRAQLKSVVQRTISDPSFRIIFQDQEDNSNLILDNLTDGDQPIELTNLQVYLDQLHQADRNRRVNQEDYLFFDRSLIETLGKRPHSLLVFLDEQLEAIDRQLDRPGVGLDFLSTFITSSGTRRTLTEEKISDRKIVDRHEPPTQIPSLFQHFLDNRLLRKNLDGGDHYELAHDSVAKLLLDRFSTEANIRRKVFHLLEDARRRDLEQQKQHGSRHFLTEQELALIELLKPALSLNDDQHRYIEANQADIARKKNAERLQFEAVAQEEKERRLKAETRTKWAWIVALITILLSIMIGFLR